MVHSQSLHVPSFMVKDIAKLAKVWPAVERKTGRIDHVIQFSSELLIATQLLNISAFI